MDNEYPKQSGTHVHRITLHGNQGWGCQGSSRCANSRWNFIDFWVETTFVLSLSWFQQYCVPGYVNVKTWVRVLAVSLIQIASFNLLYQLDSNSMIVVSSHWIWWSMCSVMWTARALLLSRCCTALLYSEILTLRHLPVSPIYTLATVAWNTTIDNAESGSRWKFPLNLDQQVPEGGASRKGCLHIKFGACSCYVLTQALYIGENK